jgi:2-keto-4-pentenoate hydratase/2-oxohepta-3-ene-1,7-dioic acid hydratase in catechol pathway
MRLMSFLVGGRASFGLAVDGGVIDAGRRLQSAPTLRDALLADSLPALRRLASEKPDYGFDEVDFLPPVADGCKLLCIGINYVPHMKEMGRERPEYPVVFVRFADSIVGHGQPMIRPSDSVQFDYEGELAVVIGREARNVAQADALDYVAGLTIAHDVSARDHQFNTGQFTWSKSFDTFCPLGPEVVSLDEVDLTGGLAIETRVSGEVLQSSNTSQLVFSVPYLIAWISQGCTLEPGDVILTGTPAGVGAARTPPRWLIDGDVVEITIERLGTLRNPVVRGGGGAGIGT